MESFMASGSLDELAVMALETGLPSIAEEAVALKARVAEKRFYVACVGQFKRGKSTLLNALLGEAVLPVGVTPVTAAVTILRYGNERKIQIRRKDYTWEKINPSDLEMYVTEEKNPENRKQVEVVEIFFPSPLLESGMCLVDTPGIGSVFSGNTQTTREFIPHIDAALVVIGADPPISGEELELVENISESVPALIFALNKADRLSGHDCDEALDFARRILKDRLKKENIDLFQISASEKLKGGKATRDWEAFESVIRNLAQGSGEEVLRATEKRGVQRLGERLARHVNELISALNRPLAESENHVREMGRCVADAEQELVELSYLFQAEQDRIGRILNLERDSFYRRTVDDCSTELKEKARNCLKSGNADFREFIHETARNLSEAKIRQWFDLMQEKSEGIYLEATSRFVGHANEFLGRLSKSGIFPEGSLPEEISPETAFRARSAFYFHYFMKQGSASPVVFAIDLLKPKQIARSHILEDGLNYINWLLYANSSRVVGDINQRILESRRQLEYRLKLQLNEVTESARQGLALARSKLQNGDAAVKNEIERLKFAGSKIRELY